MLTCPNYGSGFPRECVPGWAGRLAPSPQLATPPEPWLPGAREAEFQDLGDCVCCSLEKEALESSLFEVQRQLAQLEARREQLEADGQALLLAKEALTGTGVGDGSGHTGLQPRLQPAEFWDLLEAGGTGFGVWLTWVPVLGLPLRSEPP